MTIGKHLEGSLFGRRISEAESFAIEESTPGQPAGTVVQVNYVRGVIAKAFMGKFSSDPGIRFGDGMYYLPTMREVQMILSRSQTDRRTWLAERFDCDDFAYVLKGEVSVHAYSTQGLRFGLCFGMVWGDFTWINGYHAINWFIASDGIVRLIEPQSDAIYEVNQCKGNISLLLA